MIVCGITQVRAASVTYLADGQTDSLYTVDVTTGAASLIGSFGIDATFVGLAYDSTNDELFISSITGGSPAPSFLYRVDQGSGAATLVGNTGITNVTGLAFDAATGELFASSGADDSLYRVNPSNASASFVGSLGVGVGGNGLAYDQANQQLYLSDGNTDNLYRVNPATGAATTVGSINQASTVGLAFDPESGVLYGVDAVSDQLVSIDLSTGNATSVGSLGFDGANLGLAIKAVAIPEPSSTILLGIGMFCCVLIRRRTRC